MDALTLAVLGPAAAVGVAFVGLVGVLYGHLAKRLNDLEADLKLARAYNREMWAYCRRLLDLYYRHRQAGAPDPDPLPEEVE